MDIAIPIFENITALDAIGPYEVLSRLPDARVRFVALAPGTYRTDNASARAGRRRSAGGDPAPGDRPRARAASGPVRS